MDGKMEPPAWARRKMKPVTFDCQGANFGAVEERYLEILIGKGTHLVLWAEFPMERALIPRICPDMSKHLIPRRVSIGGHLSVRAKKV